MATATQGKLPPGFTQQDAWAIPIIAEARALGVDPILAIATALQEGGGRILSPTQVNHDVGPGGGTDYGAFQLNTGGEAAGHSMAELTDPFRVAQIALTNFKVYGQNHPGASGGQLAAAAQGAAWKGDYAAGVNGRLGTAASIVNRIDSYALTGQPTSPLVSNRDASPNQLASFWGTVKDTLFLGPTIVSKIPGVPSPTDLGKDAANAVLPDWLDQNHVVRGLQFALGAGFAIFGLWAIVRSTTSTAPVVQVRGTAGSIRGAAGKFSRGDGE